MFINIIIIVIQLLKTMKNIKLTKEQILKMSYDELKDYFKEHAIINNVDKDENENKGTVGSFNCRHCFYCNDSVDCKDCMNCTGCRDCLNCTDCFECFNSENCLGCSECFLCKDARDLQFAILNVEIDFKEYREKIKELFK